MTDDELDACYTAVCRALGEVGPARSELFLAMLNLALLTRAERVDEVLGLIATTCARTLADEQQQAARPPEHT